MTIRKTSPTGIDLIKHFEGCRLEAYRDAVGVWTIGFGHTREVHPGQRITAERAEELLREDLARFERYVADAVKVPLTQGQFDALVSFTYNLGPGNLRRSTLLRKLNAGDHKGAQAQFKRWNRAGRVVLRGLTRRRRAEADLFGSDEASQREATA